MRTKVTLIGLSLVTSLALQGCYTQLAMFHPEPVYDSEGDESFETYSRAPVRPSLYHYANDQSTAKPLGYSMMTNRFDPFYGYGSYGYFNPHYSFYNPYYYNGYNGGYGYNYYGYSYNLGGYNMFIPVGEAKTLRDFNKNRLTTAGTNLRVSRSSGNTSSSSRNGYSGNNSSNVSSTRSSSGSYSSGSSSSSSGSSSRSSGGSRTTRRN